MRDMGTQSVAWTGLSGFLAWLGNQQNLMVLSILLGIITTLANLYNICKEKQLRQRENERSEAKFTLEMEQAKEIHALKVQQLKRGLRDG